MLNLETGRIEVHDRFVEVPGGRVFVRRWDAGSNNSSPIFLLHDSLGSVDQWREFPAALARSTRRGVIAYDRLGFGRSTARVERPSIHFITEEAEVYFPAIRAALGIERFALFGHSVGGGMAIAIASSDQPREGCEAVISESAQAFLEAHTLDGIRVAKEQFREPRRFQRLVKWHGEKAQWVLDAWTEVWQLPEFAGWSLDPYLERVTCPVLAIHGDQDEFGSVEFPRRIVSNAKGKTQLAVFENCGHIPHRERKIEVLKLVSSFLT